MSENTAFGGEFEKTQEPSRGGDPNRYVIPGKYKYEILRCVQIEGFNGKKFIATLKVLESNNPERPVGCEMDFIRKINDAREKSMSLPDIRAFIAASSKKDFKEIDDTAYRNVVHSKQPLAGAVGMLSAFPSKAGTFTKCTFSVAK